MIPPDLGVWNMWIYTPLSIVFMALVVETYYAVKRAAWRWTIRALRDILWRVDDWVHDQEVKIREAESKGGL